MPGRAERLIELLQALRGRRHPVAASALAETLGVSQRTLYRDIQSLRAQGADIAGEAGVGYLLRPGFTLPPLMFSPEELDALALGARWVQQNGDSALANAAQQAMVKIAAVAPKDRGEFFDAPTLLVRQPVRVDRFDAAMPTLREAMRAERKIGLDYVDAKGAPTRRVIWPVALGFLREVRMVAAWCESRAAFRHFRVDRIGALELLEARFPRRRRALLAEWRKSEGMED
jgi:predicted DNA-binding transcriptional regulator YafY